MENKDIQIEVELKSIIEVDDWFKDGINIKRILRYGKGKKPTIESIVYLRMKITINND